MRYASALAVFSVLAVTLGSFLATSPLTLDTGAHWPTFRGSQRTGISPDVDLLKDWPKDGPPLVWEAAGAGRGHSSVVIANGFIYTLGDGLATADDQDEYLLAFDLKTGKRQWQTKTGPAWNEGKPEWQGARGTPTIAGRRAYVLSPLGDVVCCEALNGKEVWRKNIKSSFNGRMGDAWGYSESVLLDGDKLVCTPGGDQATMVALNPMNGDLIWQAAQPGNRGAGHSSIVVSEVGQTCVYVQLTASGVIGVRASDGKLLWQFDIEKAISVIPTAIVRGDLIFFSYYGGGSLLKQSAAPNNEVTIEAVYSVKKELANAQGGVVLIGDCVYGDTSNKGIPFCADLMTGNIKWKQRGTGKGSSVVIAADGCLYLCFADGVVALAKATPDAYEELSSFKLPDSGKPPCWTTPVIVGGKMYARLQDRILCYDLRAK